MYSKVFDNNCRLQESERLSVLNEIELFESETGSEFHVLIIDSVEDKRFQTYARLTRLERSHNIDNSLMFVIALNDKHAELATTYALSSLFTDGFTNNLLVKNFVPDMRQGKLCVAIVKFVAECRKQVKLQWWMKPGRTERRMSQKFNTPTLNAIKGFAIPVVFLLAAFLYMFQNYFKCPECYSWFSLTKTWTKSCEFTGNKSDGRLTRCNKCDYVKDEITRSNSEHNGGSSNAYEHPSRYESTSQNNYNEPSDYNRDNGSLGSSSDWNQSGINQSDGGGGADWGSSGSDNADGGGGTDW